MKAGEPPGRPESVVPLLEAGFDELGVSLSAAELEPLRDYVALVARWGQALNLTGHRGPEAIARHLVLGAAALSRELPELPSINDLGSGAGFPGVPLAILRRGCRVHLVEARERRFHFLREVVRRLGVETLSVERGRIEDIPPSPRSCAIAQAVGPAAEVLEWMLPWAEDGGWLVLPGSPDATFPGPDARLGSAVERDYRVPLGGPVRRLWLARRLGGGAP